MRGFKTIAKTLPRADIDVILSEVYDHTSRGIISARRCPFTNGIALLYYRLIGKRQAWNGAIPDNGLALQANRHPFLEFGPIDHAEN